MRVLRALLLLAAASASAEIRHEPGALARGYDAFLGFQMEGGVADLEAAVEDLGESAFLAVEQAHAAGRRGDEEEMVERALKAIELDPDIIEAHELLARLSFRGLSVGLRPGETVEDRALHHAAEYLRLGGRDGELLAALAEGWRLRARRAAARGAGAEEREARRQQRLVLEAWVDRGHDTRAYDRLHELADETLDFEADIPYLRAHLKHLEPDRRLPLIHLLSRRLETLDRCEEALPLLTQAASVDNLHPHDEGAVDVRLGRCANQAGRPDLAEPALERALELDPTNDQVAQQLATALWALGRRDEARAAWDAHERRAVRKAAVLERRARWENAVELSEEALVHAGEAVHAATEEHVTVDALASLELLTAEILFELGRFEEAAEHADRAAELGPDEPAVVLFRADLSWERGRRDEALRLLDEFGAELPKSSPFFGQLAIWNVSNRRWKDAMRYARRYLGAAEGSEAVSEQELLVRQRRAASVFINAGRLEDAEAVLRAALASSPSPPLFEREFVFLLADVLVARGRFDEGHELLAQYEEGVTRNAYYLEERVAWDLRHRRHDEALEHAREALVRAGRDGSGTGMERARFEALLGGACLAAGRVDEAVELLERALAHPGVQPPERHVQLARALVASGRSEEAKALLLRARTQHPESTLIAREHGRLLLETGELAKGEEVLLGLLEGVRWSGGLVQRIAMDLEGGGAAEAARRLVDEALARRPQEPDHWISSGMLFERQGRLPKSEEHFRRALSIEPTNASALNMLGYTLAVHDRKLDESVRLVRQALELRPDEGSYLDSLGWAQFRRGRLGEAEEALEAAAARDRDPVIVMHLGAVRDAQGRFDEALALYREALGSDLEEDLELTRRRVEELEARSGVVVEAPAGEEP